MLRKICYTKEMICPRMNQIGSSLMDQDRMSNGIELYDECKCKTHGKPSSVSNDSPSAV